MTHFQIQCPGCGKEAKCPESLRGKRVRCKKCGEVMLGEEKAGQLVPQPVVQAKAEKIESPEPEVPAEPRMYDGEPIVFSEREVTVTATRIVVGGTVYAMRNVTSVRMKLVPGRTEIPTIIGVVCAGIALLLFAGGAFEYGVAMAVFAAIAFAIVPTMKDTFVALVVLTSGEADAVRGPDQGIVQRTVDAIATAMSGRTPSSQAG